jgi:hypothetical protein
MSTTLLINNYLLQRQAPFIGLNGAKVNLGRREARISCRRLSHQIPQTNHATYCAPVEYPKQLFIVELRATTANMRLTTDLINNSLSFINCLTERELDLRGALERTDTTLAS